MSPHLRHLLAAALVGTATPDSAFFCTDCMWKSSGFTCGLRVQYIMQHYKTAEEETKQGLLDQGDCHATPEPAPGVVENAVDSGIDEMPGVADSGGDIDQAEPGPEVVSEPLVVEDAASDSIDEAPEAADLAEPGPEVVVDAVRGSINEMPGTASRMPSDGGDIDEAEPGPEVVENAVGGGIDFEANREDIHEGPIAAGATVALGDEGTVSTATASGDSEEPGNEGGTGASATAASGNHGQVQSTTQSQAGAETVVASASTQESSTGPSPRGHGGTIFLAAALVLVAAVAAVRRRRRLEQRRRTKLARQGDTQFMRYKDRGAAGDEEYDGGEENNGDGVELPARAC